MSDNPIINEIPMRILAFKQEKRGKTRQSVIGNAITPELLNARTFGDVYVELVKMKMNLMSLDIFDDVELTMDVPDFPVVRDTDIMVRINLKEARPIRLGIQGTISTSGTDAGLEGSLQYLNVTGLADTLSTRFRFDVIRGSTLYSIDYNLPRALFGQTLNIDYSKDCKNLLKESSVNSLTEGFTCTLASPHRHVVSGCSVLWRDLSPAVDIDIERVLNNHCSKSMINECRPSLKSSIFTTLTYDSRDKMLIPTSGNLVRLHMMLSGLVGDVYQMKSELTVNTNIPLFASTFGSQPPALHLTTSAGMIRNYGRRKTRYFDRFFLSGENVRGFDMAEIGPHSPPEDGGKTGGDALGGDRYAAAGISMSIPMYRPIGIRAHAFYNIGNIWNHNIDMRRFYETACSSYGMGLLIPFGNVGRLEMNYSISRKRFSFLFCMNYYCFFDYYRVRDIHGISKNAAKRAPIYFMRYFIIVSLYYDMDTMHTPIYRYSVQGI